jgi:hypothetical protein
MSLAETFLKVVKKATSDLDVERIREDVLAFSRKHPELTTRQKADRMVISTARKAAAVGAVASLPPGWAALATIGPEMTALLVLQSRLILGIHVLYGGDPTPEERAAEVLVGLASGAGLEIGRRLTTRVAEELAGRLAARMAGREVSRLVPFLGAAAVAGLNYAAVRGVGKAVIARAVKKYGPPEIPGRGPLVDIEGSVA